MENLPQKSSNDRNYYVLGMKIMLDMGFTIAIPAVMAAFLGQYLDEKYHKYPLFIILCLINAFIISVKIIVDKAKKYGKEYEELGRK